MQIDFGVVKGQNVLHGPPRRAESKEIISSFSEIGGPGPSCGAERGPSQWGPFSGLGGGGGGLRHTSTLPPFPRPPLWVGGWVISRHQGLRPPSPPHGAVQKAGYFGPIFPDG